MLNSKVTNLVFIRFMVPRISSKSGHVFDVGFAELDVKLQVSPEGRVSCCHSCTYSNLTPG